MDLQNSSDAATDTASDAGLGAVQRALSDVAAPLVPAEQPADAAHGSEGAAGAGKAPVVAPGGAEDNTTEPTLKGMAQRRIERLFNLLAAMRKLADRLEDINASNKGEPAPRRTTNGTAATNGQTFRRFMPAYDKLIVDCESDLMRAGKAAGELDENL